MTRRPSVTAAAEEMSASAGNAPQNHGPYLH